MTGEDNQDRTSGSDACCGETRRSWVQIPPVPLRPEERRARRKTAHVWPRVESKYHSSLEAQTPLSYRREQIVVPLFSRGLSPVETGLGESNDLRLGISRPNVFQNGACPHVNRMFPLQELA